MSDQSIHPPSIELLPKEQARLDPLVRQIIDLRNKLSDYTDLILSRVGDPDWNYTYDIRSKSLVPTTKKVTVTPKEKEDGN